MLKNGILGSFWAASFDLSEAIFFNAFKPPNLGLLEISHVGPF